MIIARRPTLCVTLPGPFNGALLRSRRHPYLWNRAHRPTSHGVLSLAKGRRYDVGSIVTRFIICLSAAGRPSEVAHGNLRAHHGCGRDCSTLFRAFDVRGSARLAVLHLAPLAGRGRRVAPGEGDSRQTRSRIVPSPGDFAIASSPTSPRKRGEVKGTASQSRRACARVLPATSRPLIRGRGECRTLGAPAAK